jgi:hypothetical protein
MMYGCFLKGENNHFLPRIKTLSATAQAAFRITIITVRFRDFNALIDLKDYLKLF